MVGSVFMLRIPLRKEPCSTYTYDSKGNLIAVNSSGNSENTFSYESGTTKLTKSVTEANGTYQYEYKNSINNHLVTKIKNDNVSLSITYDNFGNGTGTTLSSDTNTSIGSITTSATYSADGSQLLTQTNGNGQKTTYAYDSYRNLSSTKDNAGTISTSTYITSNDRPYGNYISNVVSVYRTYSKGLLTQIERGGYITGNTTKQKQFYNMTYDGFGNMTKISVGSQNLATYVYGSNNGNLKSLTYGNTANVNYEYDNLDRVTSEKWTGGPTYKYFYNSEGDLTKKVDATSGSGVNYEYDSLGRLIHSYQFAGADVEKDNYSKAEILQRTEHLYDTSNRISSQSWQLGDTVYGEAYTYDKDDGAVTYVTGTGFADYAFTYDALKRLASRYNWYFKQAYTYAKNGSAATTQISNISYTKRPGGTSFADFSLAYGYDNLGNIKSVTGTSISNHNASYSYDVQGQLVAETNYTGSYTYEYDTYGNLRSVKQGTTTLHTYEYTDSNWLDLLKEYDNQAITYDAIGNPLSYYNGARWTFTWKQGRQLATATNGSKSISYAYDVNGIRSSKTVSGVTYNYLTQNGKVVRQTWTQSGVSHVMDFVYDNSGNPYAMIYDGTKYYYVLNQQGDVIRIIDGTGAAVANYVYNAWGKPLISTGTMSAVNPIRYRGYYYDTDSELYYLQSRYYDPKIGRFINADVFTSTGQDFIGYNMFAYCNNSPVHTADQNGAWANVVIGAVVGAVINGAITAYDTYKEEGSVNLTRTFVSAGVGAVSGGLAVSGIGGAVGQTIIGAASSLIDSAYQNYMSVQNGKKAIGAAIVDTISNTVMGATFGAMGAEGTKAFQQSCKIANSGIKGVVSLFKKGLNPVAKASAKAARRVFGQHVLQEFGSSVSSSIMSIAFTKGVTKYTELAYEYYRIR